ncbi:MAG: pentapeptide repeat-containing protein [Rhodospirillaceae bacterium]|jgi:uncharacterized protein YjbI with pentapeptide repeats|nr:pentapeptide repeat-containing protein [Rhodospirillaceae bacterium]MBT6202816.1 pentapeptide repeat-containing protein [Rhodospirillaceae bacterium]MBT6512971.1 pentapeptide repeat-containing protein [Rhodospirillaceae bacterium]MBT7611818.1 pentapeptide repeat-containing protein [Rhodospirillaceae bacterium]MBT7645624.1 pentapeptide repeat-containing protein [Rhodospirillaceae bacterium]
MWQYGEDDACDFVCSSLFGSDRGAAAYDEADLQRLMKTNVCVDCDLSGADLSGMNLGGANLTGADLSDANLRGADLSQAVVDRAVLTSADLGDTNLMGLGTMHTDFSGTNLAGSNWTLDQVIMAAGVGARYCDTTLPDGTVSFASC